MSNLETSNPKHELHSSCSSPNQDKPNWLTHSKSISTQKIPTQTTLKPLGNQTHKPTINIRRSNWLVGNNRHMEHIEAN